MPSEARPNMEQDNIPVGCLPPVCQPYLFWCPPLDVSTVMVGIPTPHLQVYIPPEGT